MKYLVILGSCLIMFSCERLKKTDLQLAEKDSEIPVSKTANYEGAELDKQNYMDFVTDRANGLLVDKTIGEIMYTVFFKPEPYVVLTNLREDSSITKEEFQSELKTINDLQYFTFKITVNNFHEEILKYKVSGHQEYEDRISYFAFKMQQDMKLVEGKDTLPCVLYHFERNYGVAPSASFVLGFEKTKNENLIYNKTFIYDDKVFGTGKAAITINKKNIAELPQLKLN